jgi:hypothetical protein
MNVLAFARSAGDAWRWRIVDYNSHTVEESSATFPTIAAAVAAGAQRLREHTDRDVERQVWPPGH